MDNIIEVFQIDKDKIILKYRNIYTNAYIGKAGFTFSKQEGDKKTPVGLFDLGISIGIHKKEYVQTNLEYLQITSNMYWIDDPDSKYYNMLVDISKVTKDWNSAEHLIDYKTQYEYAIEIKTNPHNIPGKGSVIFLHCSTNNSTSGCISIDKDIMKELLSLINNNTKILIKKPSDLHIM